METNSKTKKIDLLDGEQIHNRLIKPYERLAKVTQDIEKLERDINDSKTTTLDSVAHKKDLLDTCKDVMISLTRATYLLHLKAFEYKYSKI